jgi:hypothetical protein
MITSYTVVSYQYTSDIDREAAKPEVQSLFEKSPKSGGVYGEKVLYTATGETTFYALLGTKLHLTAKDVMGIDKSIEIIIPPMPLQYLVLDHTDAIMYDKNSDMVSLQDSKPTIQSNDLLKAVVTYYTFGGEAIGTGIQLSFEMAEGSYKGSKVLYNPQINGKRFNQSDNGTATFVSIPMLLNPQSEVYDQITKSPEFWLYVEEKGDQQAGFKPEKLLLDPSIEAEDGIVYIQMNHLTAIGLGVGAMPETGNEASESKCVNCEKSSNCFIEVIMGW